MAEPPTEIADVVGSAYRAYPHVFIRRHSACVCESSGLYVRVVGIAVFDEGKNTKNMGETFNQHFNCNLYLHI